MQLDASYTKFIGASLIAQLVNCNAGDLHSFSGLGGSPGEGNGNPLQYSFLENPMGRRAWQATVHGVTRVGHDLVTKPLPYYIWGFPGGSVVKNLPTSVGDAALIPGSGRSPGERNGNLLQYSCLKNPMDRGARQATVHGVPRVCHNLVTKPPPP